METQLYKEPKIYCYHAPCCWREEHTLPFDTHRSSSCFLTPINGMISQTNGFVPCPMLYHQNVPLSNGLSPKKRKKMRSDRKDCRLLLRRCCFLIEVQRGPLLIKQSLQDVWEGFQLEDLLKIRGNAPVEGGAIEGVHPVVVVEMCGSQCNKRR